MNGWIVVALLGGGPALAALIVYADERDRRQRQERFRKSIAHLERRVRGE